MTTDHPEKQRGGRREGAGRKPTLQPLKAIRLHDPAVREALAALTSHERAVGEEPLWSQEDMVAALILAAHEQLLDEQVEYTDNQSLPTQALLDFTNNQYQTTMHAPIDYTDIQVMTAFSPPAAVSVYQLRIALVDITPEIWRRVLVRSDATLEDLHDIIQMCFGWEDYHLHQFGIDGGEYDASGDDTARTNE